MPPPLLTPPPQPCLRQVLLEKEGSGCKALLANDKTEDLERMFRLFSRIEDGLNPMAAIVKSYISSVGNAFIDARKARISAEDEAKEKNDDPEFMKLLLTCHDKYVDLVEKHFANHPLFQKAMQVSEGPERASEWRFSHGRSAWRAISTSQAARERANSASEAVAFGAISELSA